MSTKSHYDEKYFNWQSKIGKFGGLANKIKFKNFVKKGKKVLDFGCGGGYLLSSFDNIEKYGVEVNEVARITATSNNLKVYSSSDELPENFFDTIISNHALEHTDNPFRELKNLHKSLKKGGEICIVVPCESIFYSFKENDISQHLFSWSPMNLGNLLKKANFDVMSSKPFVHKWPPKYIYLQKIFGWKIFHLICYLYGFLTPAWWQIKAIGIKK